MEKNSIEWFKKNLFTGLYQPDERCGCLGSTGAPCYAYYSEGVVPDGAAILKDGHVMFPQDIVKDLNRKSYLEELVGKPEKEATIATVTGGEYKGENVCIFVEFRCGDCLAERDNMAHSGEIILVSSSELRRWKKVDSVTA